MTHHHFHRQHGVDTQFCCETAGISRRSFVAGLTAAMGVGLMPQVTFANAKSENDSRFVLIVLRGGMDGLNTVVPVGDKYYATARGDLALSADSVLAMDGMFGMNPALKPLYELYKNGEMAAVQASATPYRSRSHFDGQDLFENGTDDPLGLKDGWLNRTLSLLPTSDTPLGLSMGNNTPYVMRGNTTFLSLAPGAGLDSIDNDTIKRLQALYDMENNPAYGDGDLARALDQALTSSDLLATLGASKKQRQDKAKQLANMAGQALVKPDGPRLATMSMGGWDTHADQSPLLNENLSNLATVITELKKSLGGVWKKTTVVCVSEFGRMVYANGTDGTDHGTGGCMLLAGGALNGGRVYGAWSTLNPDALYDGRDLMPTTDVRSVIGEILYAQFGVKKYDLETKIFPGMVLNPHGVV